MVCELILEDLAEDCMVYRINFFSSVHAAFCLCIWIGATRTELQLQLFRRRDIAGQVREKVGSVSIFKICNGYESTATIFPRVIEDFWNVCFDEIDSCIIIIIPIGSLPGDSCFPRN